MVHSPTDDIFNAQQWEHWAMLFILVLGLVAGYGQAAAEDRRRAQRRRGGAPKGAARARRNPSRRRRPKPQAAPAIAPIAPGSTAPKLQARPHSPTAPVGSSPLPLKPNRKTRGSRPGPMASRLQQSPAPHHH